LTFASRIRCKQGSERQIRSNSSPLPRFSYWTAPRLVVQSGATSARSENSTVETICSVASRRLGIPGRTRPTSLMKAIADRTNTRESHHVTVVVTARRVVLRLGVAGPLPLELSGHNLASRYPELPGPSNA